MRGVVGHTTWSACHRRRRSNCGPSGMAEYCGERGARVPKAELVSFAGPVALTELSTFVVLWIDILMLGALSTRSEAGIYGATQRVAGLVALPSTP